MGMRASVLASGRRSCQNPRIRLLISSAARRIIGSDRRSRFGRARPAGHDVIDLLGLMRLVLRSAPPPSCAACPRVLLEEALRGAVVVAVDDPAHLLVDQLRRLVGDRLVLGPRTWPRNTSPSSSLYSSGPIFSDRPHLVTMLRARSRLRVRCRWTGPGGDDCRSRR